MKMLYKYSQQAFRYQQLREENARYTQHYPEYELLDTAFLTTIGTLTFFWSVSKRAPTTY